MAQPKVEDRFQEKVVLGPSVGKREERVTRVFWDEASKGHAYSTHFLDLTEVWQE